MNRAAARRLPGDQLLRGPLAQSASTSRRSSFALIGIAVILFLSAPPANACTTFCSRGLFGRNYDWNIGYGAVTVNKRGMSKTSAREAANVAKWISRYGSVTFNQYGRDNPTGGMNEAGLVVELMWLNDTKYPAADSRPEIGALEWIQYQLDTASTVAEVLINAKRVRINEKAAPLHFLVADAKGNVAAIEFLSGDLAVHREATALANDPFGKPGSSNDRYSRAAKGVATAATVDDAFTLLDKVAQQHTQWSIVYEIPNRRINWRTATNRDRRSLTLSSFDFGCTSPVRVLDIDVGKGDVASGFRDYSAEQNLTLVRRSVRQTSFLADMPDEEITRAGQWPDKSACVISRGR